MTNDGTTLNIQGENLIPKIATVKKEVDEFLNAWKKREPSKKQFDNFMSKCFEQTPRGILDRIAITYLQEQSLKMDIEPKWYYAIAFNTLMFCQGKKGLGIDEHIFALGEKIVQKDKTGKICHDFLLTFYPPKDAKTPEKMLYELANEYFPEQTQQLKKKLFASFITKRY